jgi:hypothetical protein
VIVSFRVAFVLQVIFNVLIINLCEDLWEDPWSCTQVHSTLTGILMWPTLIISTRIGLFNVLLCGAFLTYLLKFVLCIIQEVGVKLKATF